MASDNETRYILVGTRGEEANTMISKHRGFEDALDAKRFGTKICVVKIVSISKKENYGRIGRNMSGNQSNGNFLFFAVDIFYFYDKFKSSTKERKLT